MRRLSVSSIHIAALTAVLAVTGLASVCRAGDIDKTGRPELTLKVAGDIVQSCGLGAIAAADVGDLTRNGLTADTDLTLQCNVPFKVQVTSLNGGLRNVQHPDGLGPYSGLRDYQMTFAMPVEAPGNQVISVSYSGHDLRGGRSISSCGGVAFNGAHIHLALDDLTEPGLAAGDYSETIEVSISPDI